MDQTITMRPFNSLTDNVLIDSLTEYYTQYRKFIEEGGDKAEFESCRDKLVTLLNELNLRMGNLERFPFFQDAIPVD